MPSVRPLAACLALGVLCGLPGSALAEDPPEISRLAAEVAAQRGGLVSVMATLAAQPEIFPPEEIPEPRLLPPEARELARSLWAATADLLLALDQSAELTYDAVGADAGHAGTAVRRAAFLARYRFAIDFIEHVENDEGLDSLFNEAHPAMGLPEWSYARLKFHYLNVARATEFAAREMRHHTLRAKTPALLEAGARKDAKRILEMGHGSGPKMTAKNAVKVVGDTAFSAWLPAQEHVARWAGEVRVRRRGEALISDAQIREMQRQLEPGDILLQRREWYLTNAGIPGFWTHAALYVGTPEEREAFFDAPALRDWSVGPDRASFETLLRSRHPEAHDRSRGTDAGHPVRVLEAVAEGVSFTSLEHSAHADSIAVLRPRLSKRERAIALIRAFGYAGRPYDYEFDFATDGALVCSELIYKSYQRGTGTRGLELPLESVAGRLMMTPNEMARRYAYTRGGRNAPFDLVLMLDGDERTRSASLATAEAFARSWRRPKWHIIKTRWSSPAKH